MEVWLDWRRVWEITKRILMKILEKNNSTIVVEDKGKLSVFTNNEFNRLKIEKYKGKLIHLKSDDIDVEEHSTNIYNIRFGKYTIQTLPRHGETISKCIHSIKYGKAKSWDDKHKHRLLLDVIEMSISNRQFLQVYPKAVCRGYRNMGYQTWFDVAYQINHSLPEWWNHEADGAYRHEQGQHSTYRGYLGGFKHE